MTAIIVRGERLRELAAVLGIPAAEVTMSRVLASLTPAAAAAYAGRVKAREIRDEALALAATDAARQQPGHAADWEAVAAALSSQPGDPR